MDYLDPKKALRQRATLLIGYIFVAIAIALATIILLYEAYGFGIGKNGNVIQSGLVFFSSQPNPADIYINGALNSSTTNARLSLQAGIYNVELTRSGYLPWQRTIQLDGGSVEHFDYPLLIPQKLQTKKVASYSGAPGLVTQSPDRRWLLVERPTSMTGFDLYDLSNPKSVTVTTLNLPADLLAKSTGAEGWQLEEWADDSQHVVLEHTYDNNTKLEYILLDRSNPTQSINLSDTLKLPANPPQLVLANKKYDQYFLYDPTAQTVQSANLGAPTPQTLLSHVLAYKSYGTDTFLYVTDSGAPAGQVAVKLKSGDQTYPIQKFPGGTTYLLNLTEYSGTLYVVTSAASQNKAYVFDDPVGQLTSGQESVAVPEQVLHVDNPNYIAFSDNAQFIVAENGQHFGVYDVENQNGYNYVSPYPLAPPQLHAAWMDGDRLTYVSNGKLVVFDYDGTNQHVLTAAEADYLPAFDQNYDYFYSIAPSKTAAGQNDLVQTALLTPADQ